MADRIRCCVDGCARDGVHERQFEISAEWMGLEALQVESCFCCDHLDLLANDGADPPFLDLVVSGEVRDG